MPIETGSFISDLVTTNPTSTDPKAEGDDHLRLIKATVKNTFPNINGAVTATQAEINRIAGVTSPLQAQINAKAPIASPALTGVPTAPTAASGVNTTQIATTAYVIGERSATATLTNKTLTAPVINSPTGLVKADVGLNNVNNTADLNKPVSYATQAALDLKANLVSPALTGTPTAPTATAGTSTDQIATTAFVTNQALTASLPGQTGNGGNFLTTDGTDASWAPVQAPLVSGTNIKTVGGESVLGSGDIAIGSGDVTGPASATDNALVLFNGTTGKVIKRNTSTGLVKITSGVVSTAVSGTDFVSPGGAETLTNKTLTSPIITQNVQVISTATTAVRSRTYVLTASVTLTLPASPSAGDWVAFSNRSGTATAVIARNGQNIMGLAENMTLDNSNYFGVLVFADATRGWIFN